MPYFVTAPCHNVSAAQTNCTSFAGNDSAGAPAYAVSDTECYAVGHNDAMSVALLDGSNPPAGLTVKFSGGVGGRKHTQSPPQPDVKTRPGIHSEQNKSS